ncbi:hypothetical protein K9M50_00870 [Patescibacteria group bacterium]|nr:hypothetical protein [Patescibacteria group bacterium]
MDLFIKIATIVALVVNTIALIVVIFQTIFTKRSLNITKQSIDDAKTQRQLENLPKFTWIIEVQVQLEHWKKDLQERLELLQKGINEKNNETIQKASNTKITQPKDLSLNKFLYDNMPTWLRELWISGAQYYYDAITPLFYVYKDEKPNYDYSQSWIDERGKDSLYALSKLLEYLKDMIPPVILNTPASLSDKDFLKD